MFLSFLQSRSPLEVRLKQSEDVQKQLEKKMLEVEKLKQQELEERKMAVDAVEKQVRPSWLLQEDMRAQLRPLPF